MARQKALVWLLRPAPTGVEVLLLERPERRGGGYHPVTGKADEGEAPAACAVREAHEETGLKGELFDLEYHHVFYESRGQRKLEEHAFLLVVLPGSEPELSSEHVGARWAEAGDARVSIEWPAHREALDRALALWDRVRARAS